MNYELGRREKGEGRINKNNLLTHADRLLTVKITKLSL
ncbi:hypothetical protein N0824_00395 [Microcystis sp. 0824]|nr:hypothetical protein N0824_00395 [Microcystis sp. 0824]